MTVFGPTAGPILTMVLIRLFRRPDVEVHTLYGRPNIGIRFEDGKYKGRVSSPRARCIRNWDVEVVRRDRPDRLIGEDETNSDGQYVIPKPVGIKGKFYSEVSKRRRGRYPHAHRCRAATSDIIKVP